MIWNCFKQMKNLDLNDDAIDINNNVMSLGKKVELVERDGDIYMVHSGSKKK